MWFVRFPWLGLGFWRFLLWGVLRCSARFLSLAFVRSRLALVGFPASGSCLLSACGFVALRHALPYFGVVGFQLFCFLQAVSCLHSVMSTHVSFLHSVMLKKRNTVSKQQVPSATSEEPLILCCMIEVLASVSENFRSHPPISFPNPGTSQVIIPYVYILGASSRCTLRL